MSDPAHSGPHTYGGRPEGNSNESLWQGQIQEQQRSLGHSLGRHHRARPSRVGDLAWVADDGGMVCTLDWSGRLTAFGPSGARTIGGPERAQLRVWLHGAARLD